VSNELPPVLSDEEYRVYDVLYLYLGHPEGHGESDLSRFNDLWKECQGGCIVRGEGGKDVV
jgi:hypothetical protein